MKFLSRVQDYADALVLRFCHPKRRLTVETPWFEEKSPLHVVEQDCLDRIVFHEARGYYLFQEPEIEHDLARRRFRVVLTFKPTELNR